MELTKERFLEKYSLSNREFQDAEIPWEDLCWILQDYRGRVDSLRRIRDHFLYEFIKNKDDLTGLHSYRTRVKSPEHLIEKIIRKRNENYLKYRNLTKENYMQFITDTVGIRGLILYREDWVVFHKYLLSRFTDDPNLYIHDCLEDFHPDKNYYMAEPPKVHMRAGDFGEIYSGWISSDNIYDQKHYRSVHYIVKYEGIYIEVQVRTLFEEGWGEIDHHLLYPYKSSDPMLLEFSELLNRLAGMGDEMASFYKRLSVVSSEGFEAKKSLISPRPDSISPEERLNRINLKKIHTIQDAINSILKE